MPEPSQRLKDELNQLLIPIYYGAFHPYQLVGGVVLVAAFFGREADPVTFGVYGLILSPFIWGATVVAVTNSYREKLDTYHQEATKIGREIFGTAGENTESYTIEHSYDSVRFVKPDRVYSPITLIVGESSLLVYDDSRLEFDRLEADFGSSTREFYYDSITSLNYDSPHFEISLADGDSAQYRSSRKPDDVLHEVQQRVRQYRA